MKKTKKILSLAVASAMAVSLLAGCGGGSSNGGSSAASAPAAAASTAAASGSAAAAGETITFPLAEQQTLTIWTPMDGTDPASGITTNNDVLAVQELEAKTNVHIEWAHPTAGQEQEQFNLMIASGEYPDIIGGVAQYYQGGLDKAIADGVLIPLNPLIETYAPDYLKLISQSDSVYKDCKTDEGNFAGIWLINTPDQGPWLGMAVRQDWLDKCGLDTPVTYDDWHTMLTAFKEQCGATGPLFLNYRASDPFSCFSAGYDVASLGTGAASGFYNENGTVKYGPTQPGYKEYIGMLAQWYAEGLMDVDYYTRATDWLAPDTLTNTGVAGAWYDIYTLLGVHSLAGEEGEDVVAVPAPVKSAGSKVHLGQYNWTRGTGCYGITTACKNPELALAWLNLGSIEEYAKPSYYGKEGVTYDVVDGEFKWNDMILNNPDGLTTSQATVKYTWRQPGMYQWDRELQGLSDKSLQAINEIWPGAYADDIWYMPNVTLTADEGTQFANIMGDVDTYAAEMTTKFVLGQESMDNFDSFQETLKSMGSEDAAALYQAALDRFNAR